MVSHMAKTRAAVEEVKKISSDRLIRETQQET